MKKRYLALLFQLPLAMHFLPAQDFNVYLGSSYQMQSSSAKETELITNSVFPLSDSTRIINTVRIEETYSSKYKTSPGFTAGIQYRKHFNPRFSLQTGLGVTSGSMKIHTEVILAQFDVLKSDTVDLTSNNNGTLVSLCDTTISLLSASPERDARYSVTMLEIPLIFRYNLLPGKLNLGLGAKLNAPLYIVRRQRSFFLDRQTDATGFTTCTTGLRDRKDASGSGFRDLNIGICADIEFWMDKIGLSVGVEKRVTSLFVDPAYQPFHMNYFETKPFFVTAKIMYKL